MGKLLLLLAIGIVLYLLWKGLAKSAVQRRQAAPKQQKGELMVHCSHCGLHLPQSEAVHLPQSEAAGQGERYFCSEEHRRLFKP